MSHEFKNTSSEEYKFREIKEIQRLGSLLWEIFSCRSYVEDLYVRTPGTPIEYINLCERCLCLQGHCRPPKITEIVKILETISLVPVHKEPESPHSRYDSISIQSSQSQCDFTFSEDVFIGVNEDDDCIDELPNKEVSESDKRNFENTIEFPSKSISESLPNESEIRKLDKINNKDINYTSNTGREARGVVRFFLITLRIHF